MVSGGPESVSSLMVGEGGWQSEAREGEAEGPQPSLCESTRTSSTKLTVGTD